MIPPVVDLAETANTRTASLPFELSNCTVEDGSGALYDVTMGIKKPSNMRGMISLAIRYGNWKLLTSRMF
jgi:hypothetical protein